MKLDGRMDAMKYLQSIAGKDALPPQDMGDGTIVIKAPTKASVQQVEIARREAQARAHELGSSITIDLPDYQYEDKYRARCIDFSQDKWVVETCVGNGVWRMVH